MNSTQRYAKRAMKTKSHLASELENAQLKSVLSEILESTWVVKSPCYYKVLVEAKVICRAKELVDAKKN